MKTICSLLSVVVAQFFCCSLHAQSSPQDAPGPAPSLVAPQTRPRLSISQAITLAERDLATRGLAENYFIKTVSLVREPRMEDSFYQVVLDSVAPADPEQANLRRHFRVDMKGTVQFLETPTRRVRATQ